MSVPCHGSSATCDDGAYYLGRPGNLHPIDGGFGGISRKWNDQTNVKYTAAGQPRAQVADTRPYREWSFKIENARVDQLAPLHDLINSDPGPFVMVEPFAQVTNVLTPEASLFTSLNNYNRGGRWRVSGDPTTPAVPHVILNDAASPTNEAQLWTGAGPVPPTPQPMTASAYISGTDAWVILMFVDMDNNWIEWANSEHITSLSMLQRVSVTATPPSNAVGAWVIAARADIAARAALTWTDHVTDWGIGGLAQQCVVHGVSDDVAQAGYGPAWTRRMSSSFTVTEVGGMT